MSVPPAIITGGSGRTSMSRSSSTRAAPRKSRRISARRIPLVFPNIPRDSRRHPHRPVVATRCSRRPAPWATCPSILASWTTGSWAAPWGRWWGRRSPASGGARMQEGVLSLMQMAKASALLAQLGERRIPYVSILTNPTMGGVSASYAMLGDAILAEPGAVIGFAGPRVIKQTMGQDLPEGFQAAEFLLEHGIVDDVVHRRDLKKTVGQLLRRMSGKPAMTGWSAPWATSRVAVVRTTMRS